MIQTFRLYLFPSTYGTCAQIMMNYEMCFHRSFFHQNVLYSIYQPVCYLIGMLKRRKGRENKFEYLIYSVDEGRTGRALRRVKKTNWKRVNYCKTGSTLTGFCPKKKTESWKGERKLIGSQEAKSHEPSFCLLSPNIMTVSQTRTLSLSHKHAHAHLSLSQ